MDFSEETFVRALIERSSDAKRFAILFNPSWLKSAELQPILIEIYSFIKKHKVSPSIPTLRELFKSNDEIHYNLRIKDTLNSLEKVESDVSFVLYTLSKARDYAISRSFSDIVEDPSTLKIIQEAKGQRLLKIIHKWLSSFQDEDTEISINIKDAIEKLIQEKGFLPRETKIPCGIKCIDAWTAGGLRSKNFGIIIAPLGHGKSGALLCMAHYMSAIEQKNVFFVTNELAWNECTERFLAKMSGIPTDQIIEDPILGYNKVKKFWKADMDRRLIISGFRSNHSMEDVEAELNKIKTIEGWTPDAIIIDYIDNMKPNETGIKRDNTWTWLGAIAKDIFDFSKRTNTVIWTAAQTNRKGLDAAKAGGVIDLGMAQGSIMHLQQAAAIFSMQQIDISKNEIAMEFKPLKLRHSKRMFQKIRVRCDLSVWKITNEEVSGEIEVDRS